MKRTLSLPNSWLRRIAIDLVGVGGTGSEMLDGLARMHLALVALGHDGGFRVTAFDPDHVSATNVGRQRFAPIDVGRNKALTLIHRYNLCYGLDWRAEPTAWPQAGRRHTDLIISCVDSAAARAEIGAFVGGQRSTFWLDCGNAEQRGQVVLGTGQHHEPPVPTVLDLYPELATMEEDDTPSCSLEEALANQDWPINRVVANHALSLLWRFIRHGQIEHHGYFIDIARGVVNPLPIDPKTWAFFGFYPRSDEDDEAAAA